MANATMSVRADPDEAMDIDGDTVEVLVGETEHRFLVHEKIIRAHSAFFDAALNKQWKEGQNRIVKLPEDDLQFFKIYLQWLYAGKLLAKRKDPKDITYASLMKLYVLGEKLIDESFQDAVINAIIASS